MASHSNSVSLDYRPSYGAATIAALLVLVLYVITLAPETAMWDTSEYIAAAYTLGIPHPPGNPMFVLVGRVFSILPIAPSVAMRVNLLAALSSATAAGMWFLITERVLVGWFTERWMRIAGGSLAVLIGATSFTVWSQSVVNEKVYTVSLALLAIVAWLTVRWCDDPDGSNSDKTLIIIAYILGIGYGVHMAGLLPAPAVALAVLIRRPKTILRWKLMAAFAGVFLLGITPFATQPIRAAYFPAVNEGEPTGCREEIGLGCTFSTATKDAFMYNFNREQYGKPQMGDRQACSVNTYPCSFAEAFPAQIGMWWYYFKWQWVRDAHGERPGLQGALASVFLVLGLLGGWVHYKRDPRSFTFFGPLMFTLTLVLIYYLNFKYGASQAVELGDSVMREVRDRDYFYLWSFSAWSVWAALGFTYVWESLAAVLGAEPKKLGDTTVEMPSRRNWLLTSPILVLAFIPLFANWSSSSRRGETDTADFATDLLNSVEPYGILVTVGDNDTFPLWYAQEVLGVRRDVLIANTSLMNTDWYARQMVRRKPEDYDTAKGPAAYRGRDWPRPAGPALSLSLDEVDRIPEGYELPQAQLFEAGKIRAVVPAGFLQKADVLVLQMIKDGNRPVYFSRTSAGYPFETLGLGEYLVTEGLTRRVMTDSVKTDGNIVDLPIDGYMNVSRTEALWNEYKAPESLVFKGDWVDQPSVGIPYLYVNLGYLLSSVQRAQGKSAEGAASLRRAYAVARAARLDDQVPPPDTSMLPIAPIGDSAVRTQVPVKKTP
ncbi:MAG: DUF2723 domain-containing protein [Gemmatimonadetes bacterium]|nr:DUF2723 domain-containing protein [Gemmatimonadota bacterium]